MSNIILEKNGIGEGEGLKDFLNSLREKFCLEPKNDFSSNFKFDNKTLELSHILYMAVEDIYVELDKKIGSPDKIIVIRKK